MSTQEIALRPNPALVPVEPSRSITDVQRLGQLLAASGYFSDARDMAQAAVKVMAGQELGIPPVAAMMGISIIKGKVALGGNLIASRIRAHGYDYRHKQFDAKGCVLVFLGKPGADGKRETLGESSFNEDDARAAGVLSDMYKKYPRNMYFNRAISNGAKWYCPEVFAGAPVYVPEELGAKVDENGDVVTEDAKVTPQDVAAAKIAAMQQGKSYAEVSTPDERTPPTAKGDRFYREPDSAHANAVNGDTPDVIPALASTLKAVLQQFAEMKELIGDEPYYRILAAHGLKHANEIKGRNLGVTIYREMWEEQQRQYAGEQQEEVNA